MKFPFFKKKEGGQPIVTAPILTVGSVNPDDVRKRLDDTLKETTSDGKYDPKEYKDKSRKTIAYWFVIVYLLLIALIFLCLPIYNAMVFKNARVVVEEPTYQPLDLDKVLTTIGTVLGTPVGFVVGYYFKEEQDKKK